MAARILQFNQPIGVRGECAFFDAAQNAGGPQVPTDNKQRKSRRRELSKREIMTLLDRYHAAFESEEDPLSRLEAALEISHDLIGQGRVDDAISYTRRLLQAADRIHNFGKELVRGGAQ